MLWICFEFRYSDFSWREMAPMCFASETTLLPHFLEAGRSPLQRRIVAALIVERAAGACCMGMVESMGGISCIEEKVVAPMRFAPQTTLPSRGGRPIRPAR